jgi:hypothetical protein
MTLELSRTSTSCTKIQPQLRPQQTSLEEINNGKFQKSTPQMKKSEEHQQIGLIIKIPLIKEK